MIKKLHISIVSILMIGLMFSCSTSNDVASNRGIQKGKYNKGFYVEKGPKIGSDNKKVELVENENTVVETVAADIPTARISSAPEVVFVEEVEESIAEITPVIDMDKEEVMVGQTSETNTTQQDVVVGESTIELTPIQKLNKQGTTFMKKGFLKRAKQQLKGADGASADASLYYILAVLLPWLAVGLVTDWDPLLTAIAVVLWFCFWIPGIIFALVVVSNNV